MTNSIFSTIKFYVSNFGFYDYVAVSWVILLFLALFILAIYMMFKRPFFAIFLFLLSFVGLGAGINYSLKFIDDVTRPKDVNIAPLRQLFYSDVMIADINITNKSKQPFKKCRIRLSFHNIGKSKFENLKFKFNPFHTEVTITEQIEPGKTEEIKFVMKEFRPQNYTTTLRTECF